MRADQSQCISVLPDVRRGIETGNLADISPDSYRHIAQCPQCRAALLALVQSLSPEARIPMAHSCAGTQSRLAAYIDLERQDAHAAAEQYPDIWWHLWLCESCAATYEAVHALLDAQRRGDLKPLDDIIRDSDDG